MSATSTKATMDKYFGGGHEVGEVMTEDVVFTVMGTGEAHRGPDAVQQMLTYFYAVAFEATAEMKNIIYGESGAVAEFDIVGKHIGEFAGIPPTGKDVRVPLCVVYDLKGDRISQARIYMEMPVLLQQLGVAP